MAMEIAQDMIQRGVRPGSHEWREQERILHGFNRFSSTARALWHNIEDKRPSEDTIRRFVAAVPADIAQWWAEEAYLACKVPPSGAHKQALLEAQALEEAYLDELDRRAYEFSVSNGTCAF